MTAWERDIKLSWRDMQSALLIPKGKAVNVLSLSVPSFTGAIGSDGRPVMPFR